MAVKTECAGENCHAEFFFTGQIRDTFKNAKECIEVHRVMFCSDTHRRASQNSK